MVSVYDGVTYVRRLKISSGYNHSGQKGPINFLNGIMGVANAERTMGYIRILTEFISQPEYQNLIPMFGMINEPLMQVIGKNQLSAA
jgi:glucan 1,3-beta-glucosidase